jgi:anti-anti-sigma factor
MEIKTAIENGRVPITIVQVSGNLDSSTYEAFQSGVNDIVDKGARYIILDLAQTEFISSAGFRAFNNIFNKLRALHPDSNLSDEDMKKGISAGTYKSPHLKLLGLSDNSRTAFELAGFDLFIETFKDLPTAVASF